jgi:hypothetical protein
MNDQQFDNLARAFGAATSRRGMLRVMAGAVAAGVGGLLSRRSALADGGDDEGDDDGTDNGGLPARTCTGTLSGTINANVQVPKGATCTLAAGTQIKGNVTVLGALVAGGVTIQRNLKGNHAAGGLWLTGSTVQGYLQFHHTTGTPAGHTTNAICTSTIGGSLRWHYNGPHASLALGDPSSCGPAAGNSIHGNLNIHHNDPVLVSNNIIGGNFVAHDNTPPISGLAQSNIVGGKAEGEAKPLSRNQNAGNCTADADCSGGCCAFGQCVAPGENCANTLSLICCPGVGCKLLDSDPNNCGACGKVCPNGQICQGGQCFCTTDAGCPGGCCGNGQCVPAGASCGGSSTCCPGAGCTQVSSDPGNCGVCGMKCSSGQTCSGGVCHCSMDSDCSSGRCCAGGMCVAPGASCGNGLTCCGSACTDTTSNANHCGPTCTACSVGLTCVNSKCVCDPRQCTGPQLCCTSDGSTCVGVGQTCGTGMTCCGGTRGCIDTTSNNAACGPSCLPCSTGQTCVNGVCTGCPSGQTVCGTACCDPAQNQVCRPAIGVCTLCPPATDTICTNGGASPCCTTVTGKNPPAAASCCNSQADCGTATDSTGHLLYCCSLGCCVVNQGGC